MHLITSFCSVNIYSTWVVGLLIISCFVCCGRFLHQSNINFVKEEKKEGKKKERRKEKADEVNLYLVWYIGEPFLKLSRFYTTGSFVRLRMQVAGSPCKGRLSAVKDQKGRNSPSAPSDFVARRGTSSGRYWAGFVLAPKSKSYICRNCKVQTDWQWTMLASQVLLFLKDGSRHFLLHNEDNVAMRINWDIN